MSNSKTWVVDEDYPGFTMADMVENVTRVFARRLMSDTDFSEFCKLQDVYLQRLREESDAYSASHYFPGCYGDAFSDC